MFKAWILFLKIPIRLKLYLLNIEIPSVHTSRGIGLWSFSVVVISCFMFYNIVNDPAKFFLVIGGNFRHCDIVRLERRAPGYKLLAQAQVHAIYRYKRLAALPKIFASVIKKQRRQPVTSKIFNIYRSHVFD